MTRLLTIALIAAPGAALAHGLPAPHAHPHGIELALGVSIVAVACFAAWRRRAVSRRARGRDVR